MATLRITNVSGSALFLSDIYATIAAGAYVDVTRSASDIPRMQTLASAIAAGTATLSVTYSADELSSGMMAPTASVQAVDMAPVAAATAASGLVLIHAAFAAGGAAGTADDVTIYAVNTLPFKFRVVDAWVNISTAVAASTCNVWTRAAGTGTQLATLSSAATGRAGNTQTASAVIAPAALDGLFVRRSDRSVVGEVTLLCRIES